MEYAQLNEAGTEAIQITTHGNVEWDGNNFCSAEALIKDGKAEQFRVVELTETSMPTFDPTTHKCFRDGCEKVGNTWQYKWSIVPYTQEELSAMYQASVPQELTPRQIRQALTAVSLRTQVEASVAAADQDTKDWWEFATMFERKHPRLIAMAQFLGKTDEEVDAVFILGATK